MCQNEKLEVKIKILKIKLISAKIIDYFNF